MDLTVAGTKLLNARRARKLTQAEAAAEVGVTQSRISQIETGAKLDLVTLQDLNGRIQVGGEAAMDVAIDWLTTNAFLK